MKRAVMLVFFFFLLPVASALDCSQLDIPLDDCAYLAEHEPEAIALLLYSSHNIPDHHRIEELNAFIDVTAPPTETTVHNNPYIKQAWVVLLTVQPSVIIDENYYVPTTYTARLQSSYDVYVPANYHNSNKQQGAVCSRLFNLHSHSTDTYFTLGSLHVSTKDYATFVAEQPHTLNAGLSVQVTIRERIYRWQYLGEGFWNCGFDQTVFHSDSLIITDAVDLMPHQHETDAVFTVTHIYHNTLRGNIDKGTANAHLFIGDNSAFFAQYFYFAEFIHLPYPFVQLHALQYNSTAVHGMHIDNTTIIAPLGDDCYTQTISLFTTTTNVCLVNETGSYHDAIEKASLQGQWRLFVTLVVLAFIMYILYHLFKATWGRYFLAGLVTLLIIPSAVADSCGLTNLGACLPESIFNFIQNIVNAPIQPLLDAIFALMTAEVMIGAFYPLWSIVMYVLGFFYLLLFTFVAFTFVTSGHDVIKREMAKVWLKSTVLVLIFTTMSFYLYELVLDVGTVLTTAFLQLLPDDFFLLSLDSIGNVALSFFLMFFYLLVLLLTVILLALRYVVACIGVVFAPIALFCYFVPPLKSYGSLLLQVQGLVIFLPALCSIVFVACAQLLSIEIYSWFSLTVMLCAFIFADLIMILGIWHIINKSGLSQLSNRVVASGKYLTSFL